MWLKSQGNFYIEKSDSKVHLVEYMSETNENFENRIIGRDVYQILKYLKSNINRNRVVLELKLIHSRIHWVCFYTVIYSIYLPVHAYASSTHIQLL